MKNWVCDASMAFCHLKQLNFNALPFEVVFDSTKSHCFFRTKLKFEMLLWHSDNKIQKRSSAGAQCIFFTEKVFLESANWVFLDQFEQQFYSYFRLPYWCPLGEKHSRSVTILLQTQPILCREWYWVCCPQTIFCWAWPLWNCPYPTWLLSSLRN